MKILEFDYVLMGPLTGFELVRFFSVFFIINLKLNSIFELIAESTKLLLLMSDLM